MFAASEEEARARFDKYKRVDPFPEIRPALLNTADVVSYIAATGMLFPFRDEHLKLLKLASMEIPLLGKAVYWDDNNKRHEEDINRGQPFVLRSNSIAFVTLEPMFRIPEYLALRFNLRITHIYRGILLGTGPLVDPGYQNRLSMPLHNLTTNDYTILGGEGLIWMEFTKLSPLPDESAKPGLDGQVRYRTPGVFPEEKNELDSVADYLHKADPHRSIRSSIPEAIRDARDTAKAASRDLDSLKSQLKWGVFIGIIIGGAALIYAMYSLIHDVFGVVTSTTEKTHQVDIRLEQQVENQKSVGAKIELLEKRLDALEKAKRAGR